VPADHADARALLSDFDRAITRAPL
jgi:hypothetical protein